MARREVAICLGVGLPVAAVLALKPVHVGGSLLGVDCGPAFIATIRRSDNAPPDNSSTSSFTSSITTDLTSACNSAGAPWLGASVLVALLAGALALVLGLAVKRRASAIMGGLAVPPGWMLDSRGWWSPAGWVPPVGWVCPAPGYAGQLPG